MRIFSKNLASFYVIFQKFIALFMSFSLRFFVKNTFEKSKNERKKETDFLPFGEKIRFFFDACNFEKALRNKEFLREFGAKKKSEEPHSFGTSLPTSLPASLPTSLPTTFRTKE